MTSPIETDVFIWRETRISMAINTMLTLVFYALIFGRTDPVGVWGMGQWVFDFAPQSFMIALMSTLVPGIIARRKLQAGTVLPLVGRSILPRRLVIRAILVAIASATLGTSFIAVVTLLANVSQLPLIAALLLKVGYGALLAALVTPIGLRAVLIGSRLRQGDAS